MAGTPQPTVSIRPAFIDCEAPMRVVEAPPSSSSVASGPPFNFTPQHPPPAGPFTKIRHDKFYLDDGNVVFSLENTLFRFHKHFFLRDSAAFRDMFTLSAPPGEEAEGSSDDNPIILDESKKDFECFLSFYYSNDLLFEDPKGIDVLTFLRIADKYQFEQPKAAALRWLARKGTPVERIVAGRLYEEVRRTFLIPAFKELVMREYPPNEAEGALLGTRILLCLMHCQHYLRRYNLNQKNPSDSTYFNQYLESILIKEKELVWE